MMACVVLVGARGGRAHRPAPCIVQDHSATHSHRASPLYCQSLPASSLRSRSLHTPSRASRPLVAQALPQPTPPPDAAAPSTSVMHAIFTFAKSLLSVFFSPTKLWGMAIATVVGMVVVIWAWITGRLTRPTTYWKSKADIRTSSDPVVMAHLPRARASNDVHELLHSTEEEQETTTSTSSNVVSSSGGDEEHVLTNKTTNTTTSSSSSGGGGINEDESSNTNGGGGVAAVAGAALGDWQMDSQQEKENLLCLVNELVDRVQQLEATTSMLNDSTKNQLKEAEKIMLELKHQVAIGGITHDGDADALHSMGGGDPVTHGWSHVQQELVQFVSSGYLDTVTQVREQLMLREWELDGKVQAKIKGIAVFERTVAEHHPGTVPFEVFTKLYDNPDALEVIEDLQLRGLCRSIVIETMHFERDKAWQRCTSDAKDLTTFIKHGDFLQQLFPTDQLIKAAKTAVGVLK